MMGFVAKREIAGWPLVGWLATRGETIFHQRGSQESLGGVLQVMLARLRSGHSVGVFPEGRTGHGDEVGPFHARIFLAAVEAGAPVQPVALRYGADASAQTIVAFRPKESFLANFLRLIGEPPWVGEVVFLPPIGPRHPEGPRPHPELAPPPLAAVEAGAPVQPVALRYGADASAQTIVAFRPKESFLANFLRLIGEPPRVVEVVFLQPIVPGDAEGRRRIAELARARIVEAMGGEPEPAAKP